MLHTLDFIPFIVLLTIILVFFDCVQLEFFCMMLSYVRLIYIYLHVSADQPKSSLIGKRKPPAKSSVSCLLF